METIISPVRTVSNSFGVGAEVGINIDIRISYTVYCKTIRGVYNCNIYIIYRLYPKNIILGNERTENNKHEINALTTTIQEIELAMFLSICCFHGVGEKPHRSKQVQVQRNSLVIDYDNVEVFAL